jgi:hypothetical protein
MDISTFAATGDQEILVCRRRLDGDLGKAFSSAA